MNTFYYVDLMMDWISQDLTNYVLPFTVHVNFDLTIYVIRFIFPFCILKSHYRFPYVEVKSLPEGYYVWLTFSSNYLS